MGNFCPVWELPIRGILVVVGLYMTAICLDKFIMLEFVGGRKQKSKKFS